MGSELFIKSQGFPELLKKLGVQSPLVGNFWSLGSLVSPVYLVGTDPNQLHTRFRYPFSNYRENVESTMGENTIVITPALVRGLYAVRFDWTWFNQSGSSRLDFIIRDAAAATVKNTSLQRMSTGTTATTFGAGSAEFVEEIPGDGFQMLFQNLENIAAFEIACSMRWAFLGPLNP